MGDKSISAVVLAGGSSSRMGQNKALLKLGSATMIERVVFSLQPLFKETIVVTNNPKEYNMIKNVRFVRDIKKPEVKSSLVGLYSGLSSANTDYIFVVACDMPLLNIPLIEFMKDKINNQDILIPKVNNFFEPLHAFYSKTCLGSMKNQLEKKDYKILNFFSMVDVEIVDELTIKQFDPHLNSFLNINNYEEYMTFKNKYIIDDSYTSMGNNG